jgi:hypothetical protein
VGSLEDLEALTAVFEHLRHERLAVQLPLPIQRPQDFLLTPDLYPFTYPQFQTAFHVMTQKLFIARLI